MEKFKIVNNDIVFNNKKKVARLFDFDQEELMELNRVFSNSETYAVLKDLYFAVIKKEQFVEKNDRVKKAMQQAREILLKI
jgi:hypothetical protein